MAAGGGSKRAKGGRIVGSRRLEELPAGVREALVESDVDVAFIMMRLARLSRMVLDIHQDQLRTVSMSFSEYAALHALAVAEPPHRLSPSQLNEPLGLSSGGITKTVDRMEEAGLVRRWPDPEDGRGVLVGLTARGHRRANLVFTKGREHYAELLDGVSPDRRAELATALQTLLEAFEADAADADESGG
jgi:DNA-binding MarR family transcriptional regulator